MFFLFLASCNEKTKVEDTKAATVNKAIDTTIGKIDNSKVGIVDENIDPKESFEGIITYQVIMQTRGKSKKYASYKEVFGDTAVFVFSKGRYSMSYPDGKVEYIKYLRDNNQYRKMKWLDTLYFQNAGIENSTLFSALKEKSDLEVLGRKLDLVSITTSEYKSYNYYDPNMYMNPEYFKNHTLGFMNKYYELAKAPFLYQMIEYDDLRVIHKAIKIEKKKIPDDYFKLPNFIIKLQDVAKQ